MSDDSTSTTTLPLPDRDRLRSIGAPAKAVETICAPGFDPADPAWPGVRAAYRWASKGSPPILIFAGPTQGGKTTAAAYGAALARGPEKLLTTFALCSKDDPGATWRGTDWYREVDVDAGSALLGGVWSYAVEAAERLFDGEYWGRVTKAPLLVLDELGAYGDQRVRDRFAVLLAGRHDSMRPTVVTTNLDIDDFRIALCQGAGERLAARIGQGSWVQVAGRRAP